MKVNIKLDEIITFLTYGMFLLYLIYSRDYINNSAPLWLICLVCVVLLSIFYFEIKLFMRALDRKYGKVEVYK